MKTTKPRSASYTKALKRYRAKAGARMAKHRRSCGLTLRRLAGLLGLKTWSMLGAIESGDVPAPASLARRIATAVEDPGLEAVLLRAAVPISDAILVLLLEDEGLLGELEAKTRKQ